jgi:peptide/nickel transport system substrate-binding protein
LRQLAIAALALVLSVSACAKVGDQSGGVTTASNNAAAGQLRIAIQRSPNTLNPILSANTTESFINRLMFDNLISVAADGKTLVPILAETVPTKENGGISKNGLDITYHLHHGVKWQDGVPFTSKDVKFTWSAMMNNANNVNDKVGYEDVASVATPDDFTVIFHLKHIFAPFVNTVFAESDSPICIIPEHLLAKYPDLNKVPFNEAPIGTGPFKLARWVRGDHIDLVANDDYFRGKPKLRAIELREVPDENTTINLLRTHEIDFMFEPSPGIYATLKTLSNIKIVMDQQPNITKISFNTSRPPFNDVRVRQAVAYAVDKTALVNKFTGGSSRVATGDQPQYSWAYTSAVQKYNYDPAKAKALLTQAGWVAGPDGIRRKNGVELSMQISYNVENATRRLISTQVQAYLKSVGIDAPIKAYPADLYFASFGMNGILNTARYDLAVHGWVAGIDPDDHSLFACDQRPPNGTNYTRYCSAAADAQQKIALGTYDQATRKTAYVKLQQILAQDEPEDDLWVEVTPQAINPAFTGFTPNPVNEAWNAYEWSMGS